ncbi:MAG TPA: helix-turn-helix transcriptional regulator [Candidatus Omnitrophota bacterium]|nr:helix-turn-helix transcriptional regulator [Candidatus Omnitrophota bacterium]
MRPVGQTIYLWRIQKGLTQSDLALGSGVSRPNLSAIEQGARDLTVQTLRRIASALDVKPGDLVDGVLPKAVPQPRALDRFSMDRVARLTAGQRVRAPRHEKKLALKLLSLMKSKSRLFTDTKRRRVRSVREENRILEELKPELGADVLSHLIKRVEKLLMDTKKHE